MKRNTAKQVAATLLSGTLVLASGTVVAGTSTGSNKPVSDSYITTKVKAALVQDKDTKATDIKVKTTNGVVSLSGTARSEAEKEKAEQDARGVKGVTDVQDNLVVRQPS